MFLHLMCHICCCFYHDIVVEKLLKLTSGIPNNVEIHEDLYRNIFVMNKGQ